MPATPRPSPSRRQALAALGLGGLGLGGLSVTLLPIDAAATPASARQLLAELVKSEPKPGRIRITTLEVAENGNSVPVRIAVDSPMSPGDHVTAIHVISDRNPQPGVASFLLTPLSGRAEVDFRMRMAESQTLLAVAVMSDGSAWSAAREVRVTVGGCTT